MDKGAHFYKCDFQVHTPRDAGWTGGDAVTDTERKAYAGALVLACRQKGLGAIAITDHHDFAFFFPFTLKKRRWTNSTIRGNQFLKRRESLFFQVSS